MRSDSWVMTPGRSSGPLRTLRCIQETHAVSQIVCGDVLNRYQLLGSREFKQTVQTQKSSQANGQTKYISDALGDIRRSQD